MHKILLVVNNQEKQKEYLEKFKQENNIRQNYLIEMRPLKEEIVLSQIKNLKKELLVPFDKERWIIFFNFETANQESQNALLKTIEETKFDNYILITNNEYKILPTLRSRLKIVKLDGLKVNELNEEEKKYFAQLHKTPLKYLKSTIDLDKLLLYYREQLILNKNSTLIIKKILTLRRLIQDNNLNQQLALDNLLIFIHKTSMI